MCRSQCRPIQEFLCCAHSTRTFFGSRLPQQIFTSDTFTGREADKVRYQATRRLLGARIQWSAGLTTAALPRITMDCRPLGDVVLAYNEAVPDANLLEFSGETITVSVFSPEEPTPAITPLQVYSITFPLCQALTFLPIIDGVVTEWMSPNGRWANSHYEERILFLGDTVLDAKLRDCLSRSVAWPRRACPGGRRL